MVSNVERIQSIKQTDLAMELITEFIFCEVDRRGVKKKVSTDCVDYYQGSKFYNFINIVCWLCRDSIVFKRCNFWKYSEIISRTVTTLVLAGMPLVTPFSCLFFLIRASNAVSFWLNLCPLLFARIIFLYFLPQVRVNGLRIHFNLPAGILILREYVIFFHRRAHAAVWMHF